MTLVLMSNAALRVVPLASAAEICESKYAWQVFGGNVDLCPDSQLKKGNTGRFVGTGESESPVPVAGTSFRRGLAREFTMPIIQSITVSA